MVRAIPALLLLLWLAFDIAAFAYWNVVTVQEGFDALPSLLILLWIVLAQAGAAIAWCALADEPTWIRLATYLTLLVSLIAFVRWQFDSEPVTRIMIDVVRFSVLVGLPFLLARRLGFRFTTLASIAAHSLPILQFSLKEILYLITGCSILLALLGLQGIFSNSRLQVLTFLTIYSAPVWLMAPAVLYSRAAALVFVVSIVILACAPLPFSLYWISWREQIFAAICLGTEGLTLLVTTGICRACGYRIRRAY